mgnify:CR=1 FL=1
MQHLAVFTKGVIDQILTGQKTIESRFSKFQFAPYKRVSPGDEIFMKESGGKVKGKFIAAQVLFFEGLNPQKIADLRRRYAQALKVDDSFWRQKKNSQYATLLFVKNPEALTNPLVLDKHDKRAWVVLSDVPGVSSRLQMSLKFSDRDSLRSLEDLISFIEKETGRVTSRNVRDLALILAAKVGLLAQKLHERRAAEDTKSELGDVMVALLRLARVESVDLFTATREQILAAGKLSLENLKELK